MKLTSVIIFLLLVVGVFIPSFGQRTLNKVTITGYVTDKFHFPVIDAIIVINNKTSVVTDNKGFYRVKVTPDATLISVFSQSHGILEEVINGRTRINFTFPNAIPDQNIFRSQNQNRKVNEEINIGYGTIDRKNLTTPVSKVNVTDNRFSSFNSIYDILKSSVPGVMVNNNKILIWGTKSFRLNNEPLYVVDGMPVSSIEDISPRMVKSIEVLKGPAGSIYGSRGANGVILVDMVGVRNEGKETLITPVKVPSAATQTATNIQAKTATLNGVVIANDLSASVTFEYGATPGYGTKIQASQNPVAGNTPSKVSTIVEDLKYGITYHFRVVATNSHGSTVGNDVPFTTPGEIPSAETVAATNTTAETAQLNGLVNASYLSTIATFEYGTTTNYGTTITAIESPVNGNIPARVSANIASLKTGTTYHYRIVATNEIGTTYGDDETFTAEYIIGEYLLGGYIFYIDETGEHGFVCATTDQSEVALWGNCTPAGATGKVIGTGNKNTTDIVNGCPFEGTAGRLCYELEMDGYSDWFLPSINELFLMYTNLYEKGLGGFKDSFYWSSTQDKYGAWVVSFHYGSRSNQNRDENGISTRAIRSF